ncbi:hypothetical protein BDV95DRAFT_618957 [Massariosphaeria phaeospora]|uniref:Uncharacterized protein n=1 Tax=Massariosphaeria phaeospora TaxID=100035 RepID=A0A7C8I9H1_9PLEO|nr:hypothetical protein BDV95DRAFT_618957 [Massariosphaeria phaeospora]
MNPNLHPSILKAHASRKARTALTNLHPTQIFLALLLLLLLASFIASFPLLVLFVPKHLSVEYPQYVNCATCTELCQKNLELCRDQKCFELDATTKYLNKYDALERCWPLEDGFDEWGWRKMREHALDADQE